MAADGHVRARLLNDFARSKLPDMRSIALQLCRIAGLDPMVHGDDAVGIVETQFTMLCNAIIADPPTRMDRITAFNGYLYHHTKAAMRSYADGGAVW